MDGFWPEMLSRCVGKQLGTLPACALLRGAPLATSLEEFGGPLGRDRLDRVAGPKARIRLAVRDVRPEPAFLQDDRLAARGIVSQLLQRRRRRPAPTRARLRELRQRLVERDLEELLLAVQRP